MGEVRYLNERAHLMDVVRQQLECTDLPVALYELIVEGLEETANLDDLREAVLGLPEGLRAYNENRHIDTNGALSACDCVVARPTRPTRRTRRSRRRNQHQTA